MSEIKKLVEDYRELKIKYEIILNELKLYYERYGWQSTKEILDKFKEY